MSGNIDVTRAIAPKTDQLNSDDLVTGPITITIRDVQVKEAGEQRISVFFDGDNGKPWKPCVTQARLVAAIWGANAKNWIGRALTLYRNPGVKWGGVEVGGIEVSHMSHIEKPITMALTKTKGVKKPHQVKPLVVASVDMPDAEIAAAKSAGIAAAKGGADSLRNWWGSIGGAMQKAVGGADYIANLKTAAAEADDAKQNSSPQTTSGGDDETPFDV